MGHNLATRIKRLEKAYAEREQAKLIALCNCNPVVVVRDDDELRRIRETRCPAHGKRRIGMVVKIGFVGKHFMAREENASPNL